MTEFTRLDDLSYQQCEHIPVTGVAELREYELGEIVSVEGHGEGIIAAFVEESFEWEVDDEEEAVDASSENPIYVVALMDGGSIPVPAEDISTDASIEGDGEEIESWDEVVDDADDAELASVYTYCDDPSSMAELREAKKKCILVNNKAELRAHGPDTMRYYDEQTVEELQNIPGVDDPHVGFAELPEGWTRKSVLDAWASLGGMWRTCYARMIREFGPRGAKRWCAAMKDEVLGTEQWRGKF